MQRWHARLRLLVAYCPRSRLAADDRQYRTPGSCAGRAFAQRSLGGTAVPCRADHTGAVLTSQACNFCRSFASHGFSTADGSVLSRNCGECPSRRVWVAATASWQRTRSSDIRFTCAIRSFNRPRLACSVCSRAAQGSNHGACAATGIPFKTARKRRRGTHITRSSGSCPRPACRRITSGAHSGASVTSFRQSWGRTCCSRGRASRSRGFGFGGTPLTGNSMWCGTAI